MRNLECGLGVCILTASMIRRGLSVEVSALIVLSDVVVVAPGELTNRTRMTGSAFGLLGYRVASDLVDITAWPCSRSGRTSNGRAWH